MDNLQTSEIDDFITKYSHFFSEVRKRIFFSVIAFILGSILGFIFYESIVRLLIDVLSLKGVNVVFTSPFQFINLAISCAIAAGLIFVFPILIYQVLSFLKPALKSKEFNMLIGFLPFSILLFVTGFSFGVAIMKWQIQLSLAKSVELGIGNILDINKLIGTVILISALMGLAFQFPILLLLLLRLRILTRELLKKQRMWVYLSSLFFILVLPVDSLVADFLLALPLIVLFELTLILDKMFDKKALKS